MTLAGFGFFRKCCFPDVQGVLIGRFMAVMLGGNQSAICRRSEGGNWLQRNTQGEDWVAPTQGIYSFSTLLLALGVQVCLLLYELFEEIVNIFMVSLM